jgi:hypothetical protein
MTPTSRKHHPLFGIRYRALDLLCSSIKGFRWIEQSSMQQLQTVWLCCTAFSRCHDCFIPLLRTYSYLLHITTQCYEDISCRRPLNWLGLELEPRPGNRDKGIVKHKYSSNDQWSDNNVEKYLATGRNSWWYSAIDRYNVGEMLGVSLNEKQTDVLLSEHGIND